MVRLGASFSHLIVWSDRATNKQIKNVQSAFWSARAFLREALFTSDCRERAGCNFVFFSVWIIITFSRAAYDSVTSLYSLGSLTLRFGGTRKKMLVNWISHSSGRYRDPTFGHQKWTFFGFASKKWNHLARTTLTDFVTSRDITEPIKPVRWRFGLRALALRGGSS